MLKNALLLSTLLLLAGCVERGYTLSANVATQTVTAEAITSIKNKPSKPEADIFKKMTKSVKKEIKKFKIPSKQKETTSMLHPSKEVDTDTTVENTPRKTHQKILKKEQEALAAKESLAKQKRLENKMLQAKRYEEERQKLLKEAETTSPLTFHRTDKVYLKFGTSEIHGHVIYLASNGQETRLSQTKIYLLPISAKLNNWYNTYYLKNKSSANETVVHYLNQTSLNLKRNFDFFGIPEGQYYIIIESNYPESIAKNKKVYIAKKIEVGKYKKIIGVFSKKL